MLQRVTFIVVLLFAVSAFAQKPSSGGGGSKGGGTSSAGTASIPSGGVTPGRIPVTGFPNAINGPVYDPRFAGGYGIYDPTTGSMRTMTPQEERLYRAMQKQRNLEREKSMRTDMDKLLSLSKSLQDDVNGNPNGDTEKKASQIEKLAKNVKNKMTGEN